ncbi:MAG: hypothetical protein ACHRXM_04070 [Isosphaerales bacterium]
MFEDVLIAWDDEDDPHGNVQHINKNGVSTEEFESILTSHRAKRGRSRSSGRPTAWGDLPDGRAIVIVYEIESINPLLIRPVTAYEPKD